MFGARETSAPLLLLAALCTCAQVFAFAPSSPGRAASCTPTRISMSGRLQDRKVLVTGGGRGIGRAIALLCAEEGAKVAIMARTRAELDAVALEAKSRLNSDMAVVVADVTDQQQVEAAVEEACRAMGGIDLLVNNAGGSSPKGPTHEQDVSAFRKLLDLNVVSCLIVSSAVIKRCMLPSKRGDIINVSSRAGKIGIPTVSTYCASKFALEGLTATMAMEYQQDGISINSISPGMVDTTSFPKAPGRPGVRSAESVKEGFLALLESGRSGYYLHVDEYDLAVAQGIKLYVQFVSCSVCVL